MKNILLRFFDRPRLLLLGCGIVVFSSALFNGFVGDDHMLFVNNTFYDTSSNISRIFSTTYNTTGQEALYGTAEDKGSGSVAYRPVLTLTFFLDRALWGEKAWGYHLDNFILHLANVLLAYQLLLKFCDPRLALVAAMIFCIHPVQSEAVSAIGYRADMLSCFFILIAAISWMRFRAGKIRALWSCAGAYFCALFSKESALLFPVWIILMEQYFEVKGNNFTKRYYFIFPVIAIFYLWVYFYVFPNTTLADQMPVLASGWKDSLSVIVQIWATYLKFLFLPFSAVPLPGHFVPLALSFSTPVFLLSLASVIAAGVFCVKQILARSRAGIAVVWTLVFFAPACGLVPNPNPIALRYLYLPSLGLFVLFAAGLIWIWEHRAFVKIPLEIRRFLLLALMLDCAIITFQSNRIWQSNVNTCFFWANRFPDYYLGNVGVGQEYFNASMFREAAAAFERAKRDPRCHLSIVPFHLAMSYLQLGFDGKAKAIAEEQIRKEPFYGGGYFAMGWLYYQNENFKKAQAYFERAILFDRGYNTFQNLMRASYRAGDMSGLDRVLKRAKAYWGEGSENFRKLGEFTRPLWELKTVVFYRKHLIALRPFVPKEIPRDLRFRYMLDGMILP